MKTHKDIQEQKAFDKAEFSPDDEQLYDMLFKELSREDELVIRPDFAPDIAARLIKKRRRDQFRENFLFGGAIVMVIIVTIGGLQFAQSFLEAEKTILDNRFALPLITMVGLITIFQVVDKVYIRNRKFRRLKLK